MRKIMTIPIILAMALLLVPMLVHSGDKKEDLVAQIQVLEARVAELEAKLQYVTIENGVINGLVGPHIIFTGANVHIRNGDPRPFDDPNGVGNLIIGYNRAETGVYDRFASHVVVIGNEHTYTINGGLVAGNNNTISGNTVSYNGEMGIGMNDSHNIVPG